MRAGWTLARICGVLELDRQRAWRWRHRQAAGTLDDANPGANPVHGLLAWEEAEILALFEQWGDVDLSHRKLAHRGCGWGVLAHNTTKLSRLQAEAERQSEPPTPSAGQQPETAAA